MLYHLLYPLADKLVIFNVFKYITFRAIGGTMTALLLCLIFGPKIINLLARRKIGEGIREDGPKSHLKKRGTPTMGGSLILFALCISTLLWTNLTNLYVWLTILITLSFGLIGFIDDFKKLKYGNSKGLKGWSKFGLQCVFAIIFGVILYLKKDFSTIVAIPFFKRAVFDIGIFYVFLVILVIVSTSNAVNLTDGLDGLAIGSVITTAGTYIIFSYVTGHVKFAQYLNIPYVAGAGELAIFSGAMVGAGLGFLWYNTYPAQVFMGDTGSLSLGAAIGAVAIFSRHELLLLIVGGVFVLESLSVIFQVLYYKWTRERILLMAPIHHHFELRGWEEPKVTVRFWIISIVLALVALSSLKLR